MAVFISVMKNKFPLWLLLVLALFVRLYKISLVRCIAPDGVAYISAAKDLLCRKGFSPIWPPLYPWFLSILWRLGINPELSGQLVSVFFGMATVVMVYVITKSIFSQRIAIISTIFCAFHPYLVRYSAEALSDSLFCFLITSCVFLGWFVMKKASFFLVLFTGILTALAYLTKPEGFFLLPIISLWWIFSPLEKMHKRLSAVIFIWVIFLIISFPYLYDIQKKTGEWVMSQKQTIVFSIALKKEGYTEEFLNVSPLEYLKENPKKFFIKVGSGLLSLLGRVPDAYNPLLFLFLMIGLTAGIREKRFIFYIFTFIIPFFIGYAIFHPGRRYLVGWVPLTLFFSSFGVEKLGKWLTRGRILPIILIAIIFMLPKTLEPIRNDGMKWKEAGLWIKSNSGRTVRIMSEDGRVSFYADGEDIPWDEGKFKEVDYVVAEEEINSLKKTEYISGGLNIYYGKE